VIKTVIYLEKDLIAVLDAYVKHREGAGMSRTDATHAALSDVRGALETKKALTEDGLLEPDHQTRLMDASKKVTDRLRRLS
jgi:hypothetical protein